MLRLSVENRDRAWCRGNTIRQAGYYTSLGRGAAGQGNGRLGREEKFILESYRLPLPCLRTHWGRPESSQVYLKPT